MKKKSDPRHKIRRRIVGELFALSFTDQKVKDQRAKKILAKRTRIDKIIEHAAPEFPTSKINKIDLAILRLAVYELLFVKLEPPKVIIDEAVELAKEFGNETSSGFINGALGKIFKEKTNKNE